ncbi:MAG TPA: TetR/AcrR family transcriptional regulator [Gammaproteobacteria bacterium]
MADTKDRILDAAEALFADRGLSETSMRAITRAAAVNLAAVNYHFGSKDALIQAVFARRAEALNSRRLEALAGSRACGGLDLEAVLDAYIRPALEMARDEKAARYIRLLGRAYTDPNSRAGQFLPRQYDAALEAFKPEFSRQLPQIDKTELYWRLHFLIGSLVYCMAGLDMMRLSSSCYLCDPADTEGMIRRLVAFVAAGMRAEAASAAQPPTQPAVTG